MIVEKKNVTCESNVVSVYSSRLYCWRVSLDMYIAIYFCWGVGSLFNDNYECTVIIIAPLQIILCGLVTF